MNRNNQCVWIRFCSFVFYSARRNTLDSIVNTRAHAPYFALLFLCLDVRVFEQTQVKCLKLIDCNYYWNFEALYCLSSSRERFRTGGHEWVISAQGLIINIKYTFLFCLVSFPSSSWFCSDFYFLLNSNKSKWRSFSLEFIGW